MVKIETNGANSWLSTLKSHWNISKTEMRENEEEIKVVHFGKSGNLMVAYFSKVSKIGYVNDRRREIRDET